jgi:hypothetical protein
MMQSSTYKDSSTPNKQNPACTHRVGKKKLVHSDLQQYELYMQLQEMKQLGEQMSAQNKSILGENSFLDQTKAIGLKKSK